MALTFTMNIDYSNRIWKLNDGVCLKQVDMTTGVATADYTSLGFPLTASTVGFSKVFDVIGAQVRSSAGALKSYLGHYDKTNGTVRFYTVATSTDASAVVAAEIVASVHLANNDVVRLTMIGV